MERSKAHSENARRFYGYLGFINAIPLNEREAVRYVEVTLGDAAIMCGMEAFTLWNDYVRWSILPMHNGNVPAVEFIKVTILLKDVMFFFSEQESIRRRYEKSYQEEIKRVIVAYSEMEYDKAARIFEYLGYYFDMPEREAKEYESIVIVLYHFFKMKSLRNSALSEEKLPQSVPDVSTSMDNALQVLNKISEDISVIAKGGRGEKADAPPEVSGTIALASQREAGEPASKEKRGYRTGGLTQKAKAIALKVTEDTISRWERGIGTPAGYPKGGTFNDLKKYKEMRDAMAELAERNREAIFGNDDESSRE